MASTGSSEPAPGRGQRPVVEVSFAPPAGLGSLKGAITEPAAAATTPANGAMPGLRLAADTAPAAPRSGGPAPAAPRPSDARVEWVRSAVAKYERPLTQYASHVLGGDPERARDLVQEAFLRLCDQDPAAVTSHLAEWLYTVCRNLAIDAKRKDRRLRLMSEEQEATFAAGHESPTDAAERVDAYDRVVEAMAALPARQQEIVRLKFQHGMSYKQIGEVMNLTATNVGFILHTAIKALRGQLAVERAAGDER